MPDTFVAVENLDAASSVSSFDLLAIGQQGGGGAYTTRSIAVSQLAVAVAAALALAPLGSMTLTGGGTITGGTAAPSATTPAGSLYVRADVGAAWSRGDGTYFDNVDPTAVAITGGSIDGTDIGQTTAGAGAFTTLTADAANLAITGGSITGASIGNSGSGRIGGIAYLGRLDTSATISVNDSVQISNYLLTTTTFNATNTGPMVNHQPEMRVYGTLSAPAGWHAVASKPNVWMLGSGTLPSMTASQPTTTVSGGTISGTLFGNVPYMASNAGTVATYAANSSGNSSGLTGAGSFTDVVQYDGEDWSASTATISGTRYFLRGKDAGALATFRGPITGYGSNGGLTFRIYGTGAFKLTTGTDDGNARGTGAIDLQAGTRSAVTRVASGNYAFAAGTDNEVSGLSGIGLGGGHTNAGAYAGAFGNGNVIDSAATAAMALGRQIQLYGLYSHGSGYFAYDRGGYGSVVHQAGYFANPGDSQERRQLLRKATSSTSAARLTADGGTAAASTSMPMTNNSALRLTIEMTGYDTTTGECGAWTCTALIKRGANAAATAIVGSPTFTAVALSSGWSSHVVPTIAADTTLGVPNISVVPLNSNASRYFARVVAAEVAAGA